MNLLFTSYLHVVIMRGFTSWQKLAVLSDEWTFDALHNTNTYWCTCQVGYVLGISDGAPWFTGALSGRLPRLLVKSTPNIYIYIYIYIYIRGVTVHKYDGSVHTSVLTSWFAMISVQQGGGTTFFFLRPSFPVYTWDLWGQYDHKIERVIVQNIHIFYHKNNISFFSLLLILH